MWLTYEGNRISRHHRGIYATLELAKRACEVQVEEWIADSPWDVEDDNDYGPPPVLHPVVWTLGPDPGVPTLVHALVTPEQYVRLGHYCAEQLNWYYKIVREAVVTS